MLCWTSQEVRHDRCIARCFACSRLAARRHKVVTHRRTMMGMFFGGLLIAGAFTFVPGRLMFEVFFG